MYRLQGLNPVGPALTIMDLQPSFGLSNASTKNNKTFNIPNALPMAPPIIRQSDMRPHTMIVKGKGNPDAIILSKDPGVPCSDSLIPHFGNFRGQPKGLLYSQRPKNIPDGPLMPRPDSSFGFMHTKLKEI